MTADAMIVKKQSASLPMMLFSSFIVHILAILLFVVAPGFLPHSKREPFGGSPGSGGNVLFADFRLGQKGEPTEQQAKEEPAPPAVISKVKPEEEPKLESKTTLPDPNLKKKKEDESAKATLNQPEKKREGPFGTGTDTKAQGHSKAGVGSFGTGEGGPGGLGTGTGIPFPFPWYVEAVLDKIEMNWFRPKTLDTAEQEAAVVYFMITRNGQVKQVQVEKSSGIPLLDRAAETAVLSAAPFPPLPNQWTESDLAFRVYFTYTQ